MSVDKDRDYVEYVSARLSRLHRAAYLMAGDSDRADDLVQTTLLSLYLHWTQASSATNLDGYVHTIMVRRFVDERRRGWARVLLTDRTPELAVAPNHESGDRDAVVAALRTLPKGQRAALVLRYFCDLSIETTAAALHCSIGNVKSQTARGLSALRAQLDPDVVVGADSDKGIAK